MKQQELDPKAHGITEWAIYKAEETGADTEGCVAAAVKALRSEYQSMSAEEALLHARSTNEAIQEKRRKNAERRKIAKHRGRTLPKVPISEGPRLINCVNCGDKVHRTAKRCPHCSYPWATRPDRQNQQVCRGCGKTIPIFGRRAYTRSNKWDRISACPRCGIALPPPFAQINANEFFWIAVIAIVGTVAYLIFLAD